MLNQITASVSANITATLTQIARSQTSTDPLAQLPSEVRENLPTDVVEGLRDGSLDAIPSDVVDDIKARVSTDVFNRVPTELLEDPTNRALIAVLGLVAVFSFAGFVWGVMKSAMKAAIFFAIVAVIAVAVILNSGI